MRRSVPFRRMVGAAVSMPRSAKRALAMSVDASLCLFTVWLAFYLRLGFWIALSGNQWLSVIGALAIALPLFLSSGMYRAIFRYAGWAGLQAIAIACVIYTLAYASIFTFLGVAGVPRTVGLIQPLLLFVAVAASRMSVRLLLDGRFLSLEHSRVLIYGAGSSGRQLAAAVASDSDMHVVGFIDDDPMLRGGVMNGKRIHGPADVAALAQRYAVTDVLLAIPSATRQRRGEIIDSVRGLNVAVRTLPGIADIAHGRVSVSTLRELEIEDLLGRDVARPSEILFARNILNKVVLVTGAGGSIGSELCRQIVAARPSVLVLVDSSEYALYAIHREIEARVGTAWSGRVIPLIASVRDQVTMREIMRAWKPNTVYHAAAYKHVPLVEHNPIEGIRNNVFGTMRTALAAIDAGVSDFVLISTDKAVRPTNVMGTSKRLAEMVLQALAAQRTRTRFSMVRFGNVLGSSGSVVPLFRQQIAAGGPITLTDKEITRYFMTIPEAAQLVIQAGAMATGGEVFILDMGEPVKIIDLARKMVALSGMSVRDAQTPDGDIEIVEVGLRPGEKLYEELLIGDSSRPTSHPLIMKASESFLVMTELQPLLDRLEQVMDARDIAGVQALLKTIVREYAPKEELPAWETLASA